MEQASLRKIEQKILQTMESILANQKANWEKADANVKELREDIKGYQEGCMPRKRPL
jgi:hypothetical protein